MKYEAHGYVINNVPPYAEEEIAEGKIIVARYVDGEMWFYGTYDKDRAYEVADEIGGIVMG